MKVELTKEDNDIILKHLYEWNKGLEIHMKMAMDSYVEYIEFTSNDIIFHSKRTKPVLDIECDITEDNVGKSKGEIGDTFSRSLSKFEKPYGDIFLAAVREIKLNKIL